MDGAGRFRLRSVKCHENEEVFVPRTLSAILYRSESLVPPNGAEERDMLVKAALRNARLGITGLLHREADVYYQWIEGPADNLDSLYEDILADPRHRDVELLLRSPIAQRQFDGWSMGRTDRDCTLLFDWATQHDVSMRAMRPEDFLSFLNDCSFSVLRQDAPANPAG
ncbi:MAG: hypothetical protein CMI50_05190 [Paracoccus sp.]|jgi:hypothetical protein|nr:hypothetical protein [Paracoccus sp. (in: a-proteobacteria)]MBA49877.1 hypothetical protein [Paracoccus sp. (in: a-proteobacteria)]|tara:strand:- start:116 stop:619 length:504 start_codon:yes stop_codon:yes gene_type:complete